MSLLDLTVIGIDCAVDYRNVGLAHGVWTGSGIRVIDIASGNDDLEHTIVRWLDGGPGLLALDAPLGWPEPLGRELSSHLAGEPIRTPPDFLFRRETDRLVTARVGRPPLDVGADRIARTAHAALRLLAGLRKRTGEALPLLWESAAVVTGGAIEVYPAGTLRAHLLPGSRYKRRADAAHRAVREEIVAGLSSRLSLEVDTQLMLDNDDVLDAAVCLLAAADFLAGRAMVPPHPERARTEGWIWVLERG